MTARGKQVKLQTLSVEREIFCYDRRILSQSKAAAIPTTPSPSSYTPKPAPDNLSNKSSLQTWQNLFRDRRFWAFELAKRCSEILKKVHKQDDEATIIQRSAAIAVENVKQHVGNLRPKYEDAKAWADNVLEDQSYLLGQWEALVGKYASIPVIRDLGSCLRGAPAGLYESYSNDESVSNMRLRDFVEVAQLTKAGSAGKNISTSFKDRNNNMTTAFEDAVRNAYGIVESFGQDVNLSDSDINEQANRLMEEVEVVSKKIDADYHHVLGLSNSQKSIAQISRTALSHTRNLIPSLLQTAAEVNQLHKRSSERKNHSMASAIQYLQDISAVESEIAQVHSRLGGLDVNGEDGQVFDTLSSVIRLPYTYGMLLVECVRRIEWTEKITTDSSTLVEEVAIFKEEEEKGRKKWLKDMGDAVDLGPINEMSLSIDINVLVDKQKWPNVSRKDISYYLQTLRDMKGFEGCVKEIDVAVQDLDNPTRQQTRRAKAFKSGSIHDVSFGRNSLLLRGDNDILQTMKGEKSKLEDKLKSSESRIRKLEDLLHRQSQLARPLSGGNAFITTQPGNFDRQSSSPTLAYGPFSSKPPDTTSRRSSISSRRISTTDLEEKNLSKKIAVLEAELAAEKAQAANLQRDAATRLDVEDKLKGEIQDAISTKEDLMGNLEAQQREFEDERRLLEDDNAKLKGRLEEAEDELDRVLGSRDHEERANVLEEELERVRKETAAEVQQAHRQIEVLRDDYLVQLEKGKKLEHQVQQQEQHKGEIRAEIKELSLRLADLQESHDQLQSEKDDFQSLLQEQGQEVHDLKERLGTEEIEVFNARERWAQQQEEVKGLNRKLEQEQNETRELKSMQQKDRAAVESLQSTEVERQSQIRQLTEDLDASRNQNRELENRLASQKNDGDELKDIYDRLQFRLDYRTRRAVEVSRKLLAQLDGLERLIEQVGLVTVKENNGTVSIQRASKAAGNSATLNDPSLLNRSSSGTLLARASFDESKFSEHLRWAEAPEPEEEDQQFQNFKASIDAFDVNTFNEAIIKRVKEAEHLARKWQREARGYRDKSHRAQSEAHEKIAFRSFKEGDLALFLPTRNQATRPWAAFNVGAPHYFLREQDSHRLRSRDWLLARISKVEERVVDLSKSINGLQQTVGDDRRSINSDGGASVDDENPFELSDGLRWYLLDAAEEKAGAPINVGSGKVTVASANVDAKGSIRVNKSLGGEDGATKTLTRSLDSRRSSSNSKKGLGAVTVVAASPVPPGSAGAASGDRPPGEGPSQESMSNRKKGSDDPEPVTAGDGTDEQVCMISSQVSSPSDAQRVLEIADLILL